MSATKVTDEKYREEVDRSKNFPWYHESIGDKLTPDCRHLLVEYSKIPEESLEQHIYEVRDYAWSIFPFPCIGGFWFLAFGLSKHPFYERVLARLKEPDSKARLLDIGTCLGQDIRKLVFDGVSIDSLYGTDLLAAYEEAGFKLFNDADRFANHFLAMDFLSEDRSDIPLAHANWDIQTATMFLHLFDLPFQEKACRQMLKGAAGKGSWIMGASSANIEPGEQMLKPPFIKEGEKRSIYRHSKESFVQMWEKVAVEIGENISVWVEYEERKEGSEAPKGKFWSGDQQRRMWYFVEIL